jgi:16S rRNA (cytidine1402-2'-O)-methyltransferase
MSEITPATLYVVATPIGHLGDLAPRARAVLAGVDAVCAEDTRTTGLLLAQFGIVRPLLAVHEHNEDGIAARLVERLRGGASLALVADAGTPLISDPGYRLVRAVREAGLAVVPVPGACAAIAALSVAGIPSDRFCFEGFLPAKAGARRERLAVLAAEPRTLVFYESAHRIGESLADLVAAFGAQREATLGRELTKRFETLLGPTLGTIAAAVDADPNQRRGEFVLVVRGNEDREAACLAEGRRLYAKLAAHLKPSQAARLAAELSGAPRKVLYDGE